MKARGGRFLLLLGAGLAVMSFVVVYILMSKGSLVGGTAASSVPTPPPVRQVAVVKSDVPAYTMLDASNVTLKDVDASTVMSGTTMEPSTVFGKMTLLPMSNGQQIQTTELTQAGFSSVLAKGERAFALAVPERSTFGGGITENDRVDILWSTGLQVDYTLWPDGTIKEKPQTFTTTKTLLQNVKVLRVVQLALPAPPKAAASSSDAAQADQVSANTQASSRVNNQTVAAYSEGSGYTTVLILAVNDQAAEVLKFARENGDNLDLTLRSSAPSKDADGKVQNGPDGKPIMGDHENEKTTGITIQTLIDSYGLLPVPQTAKK